MKFLEVLYDYHAIGDLPFLVPYNTLLSTIQTWGACRFVMWEQL